MFGGHSRRMETSSHDALRKKFALVRSVTSLTGAFAGNFVDFQSDFFHVSSYSQDVVHVKSKFKTVRQPQLHT